MFELNTNVINHCLTQKFVLLLKLFLLNIKTTKHRKRIKARHYFSIPSLRTSLLLQTKNGSKSESYFT